MQTGKVERTVLVVPSIDLQPMLLHHLVPGLVGLEVLAVPDQEAIQVGTVPMRGDRVALRHREPFQHYRLDSCRCQPLPHPLRRVHLPGIPMLILHRLAEPTRLEAPDLLLVVGLVYPSIIQPLKAVAGKDGDALAVGLGNQHAPV